MRKRQDLVHFLFGVYLVLLFVFVVVKFDGNFAALSARVQGILRQRERGVLNANFQIFSPITQYYIRNITEFFGFLNIAGNTLPFIPLGFFVPLVFRSCQKPLPAMCCCLVFILFVETFQLITCLGYFDVDDILLNFLGCLAGYLCFRFYSAVSTKNS